MGLLLSRMYESLVAFTGDKPARVLMLGLDAAGKTTILYKVKLNENVQSIPTIGFNVEMVTPAPGITFTVWDVGGQDKIRPLWAHYYQGSDGLLFVIDSADRDRLREARDELFSVINNENMSSVPFVIIANKADLPTAMKPSELIEQLSLHSISKRRWYIQTTCAVTGDGIIEAMQQLAKMIKDNRKSQTY